MHLHSVTLNLGTSNKTDLFVIFMISCLKELCVSVRINVRGHLVMSIIDHLILSVHFWTYLVKMGDLRDNET